MGTLSKIWNGFLNIFGLRKKSKYVKNYLNEANMRSAIFMSSVIFVLEIWLIIRQTHKYVIPGVQALGDAANFASVFKIIFQNTSNFFLLMSMGFAMFIYSIQYVSKVKSVKRLVWALVFAGLSLCVCALLPLEFYYNSIKFTSDLNTIKGIFKICFYISVILFDLGIIFASIYRYKGGKRASLSSVLVISLFAFVCLMFGIMVSYGDFVSVKTVKDAAGNVIYMPDGSGNVMYENKQIICFLMFMIYIGCLLIWNPLTSLGILGTLSLGFYFAIKGAANLGQRRFPEGDEVNYLTFFISLTMVCISIFNQRISEANKDEALEELATKDKITGLLSFEYFILLAKEKTQKEELGDGKGVYLFFNITSFKIYNDKKGFAEGNVFLRETGEILTDAFGSDALISRQADDHFVVFTRNDETIPKKISKVDEMVNAKDPEVRLGIKAGAYSTTIPDEKPRICVDKARYAYHSLKNSKGALLFQYYDEEMHDNFLMTQYIVTHIDEAVANGYIKPYYQPVVWSKGRTLCGVEALARWIDPRYGFLSPGKFIPALENAQQVYKLDKEVLRLVCQDIRRNLDSGLPVLPVSINFSRADFGVIDIVEVVNSIVDEYQVPHELLHVEITESALTNEVDLLKNTINRLHENGFATWLDDFGSGYSSFNVLKDYDFDVLKLDMAFLSGFNGNEKAKALIRSVINMANQIGMKTLCEGVETKEQAEFLEEACCGRLQGYLYGKPLSYDELLGKIKQGEYNISRELIN